MPEPRLRYSARALVVDRDGRVLLDRSVRPDGISIWFAPGGGVEEGESVMQALHRELLEETGLVLDVDPPHVWRQRVLEQHLFDGFDGLVNDYFLVRCDAFEPAGTLTPEQLRAEWLEEHRWWSAAEIMAYEGDHLFGPRDLAALLSALLRDGPPAEPLAIGL